jgi:hypothetical protein
MKKRAGFVLSAVAALCVGGSGLAAVDPAARAAECQEGSIAAADDGSGTYSRCSGGVWIHVEQQLCVDYPDFAPNCTGGSAAGTSSSARPAPPAAPVPVPVPVDTPYVPVPSAPNVNTGHLGCTWVNGYTRKSGTHVSGYWRC